jgi:cell division protein FtsB
MVARKSKKRKPKSRQAVVTKIFWVASFSFLFIYLAFANVRIFWQSHENSVSLKKLKDTAASLQTQKDRLSAELGMTTTPEYLEKVAREEFGYKKAGEQVVVVKKEEAKGSTDEQANNLQFLQNIIDWVTGLFK